LPKFLSRGQNEPCGVSSIVVRPEPEPVLPDIRSEPDPALVLGDEAPMPIVYPPDTTEEGGKEKPAEEIQKDDRTGVDGS